MADKDCRPQLADKSGKIYEELSRQFHSFVISGSKPLNKDDFTRKAQMEIVGTVVPLPKSGGYRMGHDSVIRQATEQKIEEFNSLFLLIEEAIDQAYKNGQRKGQDLLGQLASGQLSVEQLNRKALEAERDEDDDQ